MSMCATIEMDQWRGVTRYVFCMPAITCSIYCIQPPTTKCVHSLPRRQKSAGVTRRSLVFSELDYVNHFILYMVLWTIGMSRYSGFFS